MNIDKPAHNITLSNIIYPNIINTFYIKNNILSAYEFNDYPIIRYIPLNLYEIPIKQYIPDNNELLTKVKEFAFTCNTNETINYIIKKVY